MSQNIPRPQDDSSVRKRVGKACDRCRNKKSKCDGLYPCNRCREDNVICLFGERDKTQDKTWPRGTVELQQKALRIYEDAILELYTKSLNGFRWNARPVSTGGDGRPLIHEILTGVGVCGQDCTLFNEIHDKVEKVLHEQTPMKPYQQSLKREGDLDVKMETPDIWSETIPQSIQDHPRTNTLIPHRTMRDAIFPPSPPKENLQQAPEPGQRVSPSESPSAHQGRKSNRASFQPTQMTLPTPNRTPSTETTPQVSSSSYYPLSLSTTAPQNHWPYNATTCSTGSFPSYESTPVLGDQTLYDDPFNETQGFGWPTTSHQLSSLSGDLLNGMEVPAPQNMFGYADYPY